MYNKKEFILSIVAVIVAIVVFIVSFFILPKVYMNKRLNNMKKAATQSSESGDTIDAMLGTEVDVVITKECDIPAKLMKQLEDEVKVVYPKGISFDHAEKSGDGSTYYFKINNSNMLLTVIQTEEGTYEPSEAYCPDHDVYLYYPGGKPDWIDDIYENIAEPGLYTVKGNEVYSQDSDDPVFVHEE